MLKIRMFRTGKKDQPTYRIVVMESTNKRNGKYIDVIGYYIPGTTNRTVSIKQEKMDKWIHNGAQMTASVKNLLTTIEKEKTNTKGEGKETKPSTSKTKVKLTKTTKTEESDSKTGKKEEKEL